jgi:hypothetical protein
MCSCQKIIKYNGVKFDVQNKNRVPIKIISLNTMEQLEPDACCRLLRSPRRSGASDRGTTPAPSHHTSSGKPPRRSLTPSRLPQPSHRSVRRVGRSVQRRSGRRMTSSPYSTPWTSRPYTSSQTDPHTATPAPAGVYQFIPADPLRGVYISEFISVYDTAKVAELAALTIAAVSITDALEASPAQLMPIIFILIDTLLTPSTWLNGSSSRKRTSRLSGRCGPPGTALKL